MKPAYHCPSEQWLFQNLDDGLDAKRTRHLQSCDACRRLWKASENVSALAKALPHPSPDVDRMTDVRARLLTDAWRTNATRHPKRRNLRFAAVAAAALIISSGIVLALSQWMAPTAEQVELYRGRVHPHNDAHFLVVQSQPDEIVRLTDGTITVRVSPLKKDEQFRVVVGNSQVVVKGTVFDVTAANDRLVKVRVISGRVVVQNEKQTAEILTNGQTWQRSVSGTTPKTEALGAPTTTVVTSSKDSFQHTTPKATAVSRKPARNRSSKRGTAGMDARTSRVAPQSTQEDAASKRAAEAAFRRGWRRLQDGEFAASAIAFDAALSSGAGALSEDAAYWLGVAHSRAKAHDKAAFALETFVQQYPGSPRLDEAYLLLGWTALERGDIPKATACFERGKHAFSPKVRRRSKEGLETIRRIGR